MMITVEEVLAALRSVQDPELGRDLVSLNMVTGVEIREDTVRVTVNLTTPACPLETDIDQQCRQALLSLPGVNQAEVHFTSMAAVTAATFPSQQNLLPDVKPKNTKDYGRILERLTDALASVPDSTLILEEASAHQPGYRLATIVLGHRHSRRALLTAGTHGDEPSGVEALCVWLEQRRYRPWLDKWQFVLLPCLNPWGYEQDIRENHDGKDLNREFNAPHPAAEIRFVHPILQQPFDLVIDLHDDRDSHGYYLYQSVDAGTEAVGRQIVDRVGKVTSINENSEIEGRSADRGVIDGPCNPDRLAWWPLAAYAQTHGVKRVLTLEAPGRHSIEVRVQAHLTAIEAAIEYCTPFNRE